MLSSRLSLFKPKQEIQDLKSTLNNFNAKIDQFCAVKTKEITRLNAEFDDKKKEIERSNDQLQADLDSELQIKGDTESTFFNVSQRNDERRQLVESLNTALEDNETEIEALKQQETTLRSNISSLIAKIAGIKRSEESKKMFEKPILEFYEQKLGLKMVPIENGSCF